LFEKIADNAKLTSSQKSIVILLTTLIKNRNRILTELNNYEDLKKYTDLKIALNFIDKNCVQYVNETGRKVTKHFPIVKIPESFCSAAVNFSCRFNENNTVGWMMSQSYFGNMNLSDFMQDLNESYIRFQWTQLNKTSKNTSGSKPKDRFEATFYMDIYANTRSDGYPFYDKSGAVKIFASGASDPYKMRDLKDLAQYINSIRDPSWAKLDEVALEVHMCHNDWKKFHPAYQKNNNNVYIKMFDYDNSGTKIQNTTAGLLTNLESMKLKSLSMITVGDIIIKSGPESQAAILAKQKMAAAAAGVTI
jgi:hypothetical protein